MFITNGKTINVRLISLILIGITLIPYISPYGIIIYANAQDEEEDEPVNQNSVNLDIFDSTVTNFQIYDNNLGYGVPLATIRSGDKWDDQGSYIFPGVQVWTSEPFLSNYDGSVTYTSDQYIIDPDNVIQVSWSDASSDGTGGTYNYFQVVNIAFDVAMRTYSNLPYALYDFYPIQVMKGRTFSASTYYGSFPRFDCWKTAQNGPADGLLLGVHDYGLHTIVANILDTRGAVPFRQYRGDYDEAVGWIVDDVGAYSLEPFRTAADISIGRQNLVTRYGNSRVMIRPTINFEALEGFIKYDYLKEADPLIGGKFEILSESTKMAVLDARLSTNYFAAGKMRTYVNATYQAPVETGDNEDDGGDSNPTTTTKNEANYGHVTNTVQAYYTWDNNFNDVENNIAGEILRPRVLAKDFEEPRSISIDTFNLLPRSVDVGFDQVLQPYTSVWYATFNGRAVGFHHFDLGQPTSATETEWYNFVDRFPYRIKVENIYAINRVVMTVAVLSQNKISYIPAAGTPVPVDSLLDYGINSVGFFNPGFLGKGGGASLDILDILNALFGLLSYILPILISIGVIVVVVKLVPSKRKEQLKTI